MPFPFLRIRAVRIFAAVLLALAFVQALVIAVILTARPGAAPVAAVLPCPAVLAERPRLPCYGAIALRSV